MPPQQTPLMPPVTAASQPVFLRPASQFEMLRVGILGLLVGVLVPLVGQWLTAFFIKPVFCNSGNPLGMCTDNTVVGYGAAISVLGILALVVLANWQVFRPLLIVIAAIISFWGFQQYVHTLANQGGWLYYVLSAGLFAVAYVLFYWLMRLHNFLVGVVLMIAAIIAIRLALLQ